MSPQTRPDMVELTFEVPDRLLGQFYVPLTAIRNRRRGYAVSIVKAGLRAKEIASLTWEMITDADGKLYEHLEYFPSGES